MCAATSTQLSYGHATHLIASLEAASSGDLNLHVMLADARHYYGEFFFHDLANILTCSLVDKQRVVIFCTVQFFGQRGWYKCSHPWMASSSLIHCVVTLALAFQVSLLQW